MIRIDIPYLETFYEEVDRVMTKDLEWETGHNLSAFDDILCGGFGVHERGEPVVLVWKNTVKSKVDLGIGETTRYYEEKIREADPVFRNRLQALTDGNGQTLFEIITGMIERCRNFIQFVEA